MANRVAMIVLMGLALGCSGGSSSVKSEGQGAGADRARLYPCKSLGEVLRAVQATQPARVGWVLPASRLEEGTGKAISNETEAWDHLRSKAGVLVRDAAHDLCIVVDSDRSVPPVLSVERGGPDIMWDRLARRARKMTLEGDFRTITGFVRDCFDVGMKFQGLAIDREEVYSVSVPPMRLGELLLVIGDGWGVSPSLVGGRIVWRGTQRK